MPYVRLDLVLLFSRISRVFPLSPLQHQHGSYNKDGISFVLQQDLITTATVTISGLATSAVGTTREWLEPSTIVSELNSAICIQKTYTL